MTTATRVTVLFLTAKLATSSAKTNTTDEQVSLQQVAALIGIKKTLAECENLRCYDLHPGTATLQQVLLRQQITDAVLVASLEVESVLAQIDNEHARLLELSSLLQGKAPHRSTRRAYALYPADHRCRLLRAINREPTPPGLDFVEPLWCWPVLSNVKKEKVHD